MDRMIYKYGYKINAKRLAKKDKWYWGLYDSMFYQNNQQYLLTWDDNLGCYVLKEWRPFKNSRDFHSKLKKRNAGIRRSKRKAETKQIIREALKEN